MSSLLIKFLVSPNCFTCHIIFGEPDVFDINANSEEHVNSQLKVIFIFALNKEVYYGMFPSRAY